jgi:hypothetical protein
MRIHAPQTFSPSAAPCMVRFQSPNDSMGESPSRGKTPRQLSPNHSARGHGRCDHGPLPYCIHPFSSSRRVPSNPPWLQPSAIVDSFGHTLGPSSWCSPPLLQVRVNAKRGGVERYICARERTLQSVNGLEADFLRRVHANDTIQCAECAALLTVAIVIPMLLDVAQHLVKV